MKSATLFLFLAIAAYGCTQLYSESDNKNQASKNMEHKIITSLTFQKEDAEQAMNFYVSLFGNAKIIEVKRWGEEMPGKENTIKQAVFELNGKRFMCSDSPIEHNWDFSPAIAIYVECEDLKEIKILFKKLKEGGEVAMPLDDYGFSQKFGWVVDKFGVSWQLNLK